VIDGRDFASKPTFRRTGDFVEVVSHDGSTVFTFDLSKLVDVDNSLALIRGSELDLSIIEEGIRAVFRGGQFDRVSPHLSEPGVKALLSTAKIGRPFLVRYIGGGADYYIVPVLEGSRMLAAASVLQLPNGLETGAIFFWSDTSKQPFSLDRTSPLTHQGAFSIASVKLPKYTTQAVVDSGLERVKARTNLGLGGDLGFLWRFKSAHPGFYIGPMGELYKIDSRYQGQSLGNGDSELRLVELK
jgi:hypothetical protein